MHDSLSIANSTPARLLAGLALLLVAGCSGNDADGEAGLEEVTRSLPLRVVVVDSPALAQSIRTQWLAHDGGDIQLRERSIEELLSTRRLLADVVVYPSAMIGELAMAGHLQPLSFPKGEIGWSGEAVLDNQRVAEVSWGSDLYAVSFGSPQPMLAYRQDIFQELGLEPPTTWASYLEVCRKLDAFRAGQQETLFSGVAVEPTASGDAAITLLARAASYARHRNQYSGLFDFISMQPLIAGPPFQRALAELLECQQFQPGNTGLTSTQAFGRLLAGECLMAISWSLRDPDSLPAAEQTQLPSVAVVELPGSSEVYNINNSSWKNRQTRESVHIPLLASGGRLGSVTELAHDRLQATEFLMFVTSSKIAHLVCRPSPHTFPFRQSHVKNPRGWLPKPLDAIAATSLGEAAKNAGGRNNYLFALRIPGRQQYLAALDEAVQAALAGESPSTVLQQASDRWKQITEELGTDKQKAAYRFSLGLEN
jgi:multiple sugar transport system substrate-binding protein